MAALPWFKIYAAETLSDERFQGWNVDERGAWFTLLVVNWREGSIPSDLGALARLLHVDANRMRLLWDAIGDRFIEHPDHPGRLASPRLEKEREEAEERHEKKSAAGKKAATSRWDKGNGGHTKRMRSHTDRNAVPIRLDADQPSPESDPDPAQPAVPINGMPAALPGWLAGLTERLSLELGRTLGVGADARAVVEAFTARRELLLAEGVEDPEEHLVADCLAIAKRSRVGTPETLAFFPGWFTTAAASRRAP